MRITDELREYICQHATNNDELRAIADRIDEAHKRAIAYVDDRDQETMAEHGWVKFPPLDADGEPWHIGDEIDNQFNLHLTVSEISYESNGCWMLHAKPNWRFYANIACHYHRPTVEDVLREFADRYLDYEGIPSAGRRGVGEALMDEYAAMLRLKEDA